MHEHILSLAFPHEYRPLDLIKASVLSGLDMILNFHYGQSFVEHVVADPVVQLRNEASVPSSGREVERNVCGDVSLDVRGLELS